MSKKTPIPGEEGDIAQTYNPVTMIANQEARHVALLEQNEKNM